MPNTERERRIAMLRAALPYTAGHQRHALDLVLQADTLANTIRGISSHDLEAYETQPQPEEMLLHMQEYCTPRESDLIQMVLNFIKASHLFQNYRDFVASQHQDQHPGELEAAGRQTAAVNPIQMLLQMIGGLGGLIGPGKTSDQMMDFLLSQISPEQRQLFEQLRGFSTENENFSGEGDSSGTGDFSRADDSSETGEGRGPEHEEYATE